LNVKGDNVTLAITALYAGILALIVVALAINVTVHRAKLKVPLGDGGNPAMLRMMRLHANAVEYLPLALVLMAIYEITGGSHTLLHVAGIVLIVGRILQTWNMWSTPMAGFGRLTGQSSTWLTIVALAGLNLWKLT
jgi:uncharacterized membrane protein YecN with MAPEG domain